MFQNISKEVYEHEDFNNENYKIYNIKNRFSELFSKQNIALYIITLMASTVSIGAEGVAPFGLAMFAAACSNTIPVGIVFIMSLIGTIIGFGSGEGLVFIISSLIFIGLVLLLRPGYLIADRNEKRKLGKYLLGTVLVVQVVPLIFTGVMLYDLISSVSTAIITYIFYKIFSNSLIVIGKFQEKKAFTIEEVIGASLLISIAVTALGEFSVFGLQIRNVISILLVLILGWKNGVLVGATSGITIGSVLGIITGSEPVTIASYALSGMLAGLFSRFGKIGVIIGFLAGNTLLTYVTNGNTLEIIYFKEILVASLGLLLVPNRFQIDIEELFKKDAYLPATMTNQLPEAWDKLSTVSETIKDISDTYKIGSLEEEQIKKENKKVFKEQFLSAIEEKQENLLYDELINAEEITDDIFEYFMKKQEIDRQDIIDIFEKYHNYLLTAQDKEENMQMEKDIYQIVKIANESYIIAKVNFIYKQKIDENKKNISNQLNGVSKVISSIAYDMKKEKEFEEEEIEIKNLCKQRNINLLDINIKRNKSGRYLISTYLEPEKKEDIDKCPASKIENILSKILEEKIVLQKDECAIEKETNICKQIYTSKDKYKLQIGIAKTKKEGSPVSGDCSVNAKLEDGKYLIALSDGMGSGPEARKSSSVAVKMLKRMLSNGFDKDTSIELINSTLSLNTQDDMYATLDVAILDLYAGNIEFIKNGACPTFIKNRKKVQIIKSLALPAGIIEKVDLVVHDRDIEEGDIIVICSDGILESNKELQNKEIWVKDLLEELITDNPQKIADILLQESIDNGLGKAKDDMTVIVAKVS